MVLLLLSIPHTNLAAPVNVSPTQSQRIEREAEQGAGRRELILSRVLDLGLLSRSAGIEQVKVHAVRHSPCGRQVIHHGVTRRPSRRAGPGTRRRRISTIA